MKKYKLIQETKEYGSLTLHRIEAVADFDGVKAGERGGFVEKEENLSHDGDAWVSGNARVSGDAWVYGKLKANTGYYFAYKRKGWEIKEVELDDEAVVLWRQ